VDVTSRAFGSAVQEATQNCVTYVSGGNTLNIGGSGNVVQNVDQEVVVSVDAKCAADTTQSTTFATTMQDSFGQQLKDQQVALTQWLDSGRDDNEASINQDISMSVRTSTIQNCLANIDQRNLIDVGGSGNVVADVVQKSTTSLLSQCLMGSSQTADMVNDITNKINQTSEYESKNPLAFITDAISAMFKSLVYAAAIALIVLICLAGIFMVLRGRRKRKEATAQAEAQAETRAELLAGIRAAPAAAATAMAPVAALVGVQA
jgi:hypothetical protein